MKYKLTVNPGAVLKARGYAVTLNADGPGYTLTLQRGTEVLATAKTPGTSTITVDQARYKLANGLWTERSGVYKALHEFVLLADELEASKSEAGVL